MRYETRGLLVLASSTLPAHPHPFERFATAEKLIDDDMLSAACARSLLHGQAVGGVAGGGSVPGMPRDHNRDSQRQQQ